MEYLVLLILVSLVVLGMIRVFGGTIKTKLSGGQGAIETMEKDQRRIRIAEASKKPIGSASGKPDDEKKEKGKKGSGGKKSRSAGVSTIQGSGAGSGVQEGGVGEEQEHSSRDHRDYIHGSKKEEEEAGFNPFILLIIAGIVGFLVYFVIKGNKAGAAA